MFLRYLLLLVSASALMLAHELTPSNLQLTFPGPPATITLHNSSSETGCTTQATVTVSGDAVTVAPLTATYSTPPDTGFTFTVTPVKAGNATITVTWTITSSSPSCSGGGSPRTQVSVSAVTSTTPPTAGGDDNTQISGDPVSLSTGESNDGGRVMPDLSLGGPLPFHFARYYASYLNANAVAGALGPNWLHNFDVSLASAADTATVTLFGGRKIRFKKRTEPGSENLWGLDSVERVAHQLIGPENGAYRFLDQSTGLIYSFDAGGRLTSIADRNANALTVTQSSSGPVSVSDGLGRTLTFTYTGAVLTRMRDQSGRTVEYRYAGGELTSVLDVRGNTTTYSYTTAGGIRSLRTSITRPVGNRLVSHEYNTAGQVSRETNATADATTITYNQQGATRTTTVTDATGRSENFTHPVYGSLTNSVDGGSNTYAYTYDGLRRVIGMRDSLGNQGSFTYHAASGYLAAIRDFLGRETTATYQEQTQDGLRYYVVSQLTGPDGAAVRMEYDAKGNVTRFVDQTGAEWRYTYNSRGQVLTATNPAGATATNEYNDDGSVRQNTDFAGVVRTYGYDASKRLNLVRYADGGTHRFERDATGNLIRETNELSRSTAATYDANNNIATMSDAFNRQRRYELDGNERLTRRTDRRGNVATYTFDRAGLLTQARNGAGETGTFTWDPRRLLASISDALGPLVQFTYDRAGRLAGSTDGLNKARTLIYDAAGRPIRHSTPGGQTIEFAYTIANKLASVRDPLGRSTTYQYDARGRLTGINRSGISAAFELNSLGLTTAITDPAGNRWTREYDGAGRQTAQADPLGRVTRLRYNSRGRLDQIATPLTTVDNTYDAVGNLLRQDLGGGSSLQFTYDDQGRLLTADGVSLKWDAEGGISESNSVAIERDAAGRVVSMALTAARRVRYTYDVRGRVTKVSDWIGGDTDLTWDAANRVTSIRRPNGVVTQYTYDANDRVTRITEARTANLASISITRDAAGQVTTSDRTVPLDAAPAPGVLPVAHDAAHQVVGASYDDQGRLTADVNRAYTWDRASRLLGYAGSDGTASFTYDGLGNRVSRTSGGTTENYVLNYGLGLPSISIVRSGGTDRQYYVHLPNGILLHTIDSAGSRRFYHFDETGSTFMLTGDDGVVTDSYASGPYGEEVRQTGASTQPFVYHGAFGVMREGQTPLYYMRARYYDAATARFISRDPINTPDPLQANPYQFAAGNPMLYGDPTGLSAGPLPGITCTGPSFGNACPDSGVYLFGSPISSLGGLGWMFADFRLQEYNTFIRGFNAHFGAIMDGVTDINQVARINDWYTPTNLGQPLSSPGRALWYAENIRTAAELEDEAARAARFARAGKVLTGIGITLDVGLTIYDGVNHGDSAGTIAVDTGAVLAGDVAVLAAPPLALADAVTLGGVSGSITNAILAPVDTCKILTADRFTPADAARVKQRWTRKPLLGAIWWLGEGLADIIVPD